MASRRARTRPDKRAITYHDGEAPDIERAFQKLTAERKPVEEPTLTLRDGSVVDLREPWKVPNVRAEAPTPAPERTR